MIERSECFNFAVLSSVHKVYFCFRFLLPKDIQQLLEDRVKTFNNMAQVPGTNHNGSLYYKTLGSHSTVNSLVNF